MPKTQLSDWNINLIITKRLINSISYNIFVVIKSRPFISIIKIFLFIINFMNCLLNKVTRNLIFHMNIKLNNAIIRFIL